MNTLTVDVRESAGRILCTSIFSPGGKKLFGKGHILSHEDVRFLDTEGMAEVWVTALDEGEIAEDEAVMQVARAIGSGSLEIRPAAGGRANIVATRDCCVLVDDELLKQINCAASIVIATLANFSFAQAGQRVATIKSTPFAVAAPQLEAVMSILRERGPILQVRPMQGPQAAVLYTDPVAGDRSRQLFESVMQRRLERFGASSPFVLSAVEEEALVVRALQHLVWTKPSVILIASTTAPAGPEDVIGRAMQRIGCHLERFLAPVEPGSLLLMGYKDDIPIVSAPGCFRSAKTNVVDLILPALFARYRISGWEIACLGHGGLLT